ncbi:MAG: hypothetical protein AAB267_03030 [Candidatus Desantisbacteria bacterium]
MEREGSTCSEEVLKFIKEEPAKCLNLYWQRFLFFWSNQEIPNNMNYDLIRSYSWILKMPFILSFGFIASLALCGFFLSLSQWRRLFLLYMIISGFMVATLLVSVLGRFRLPIVSPLIIFAGFTLFWWYEKIKKKGFVMLFLSVILLFFSTIFVYFQSVTNIFYPHFNPKGVVVDLPDRIIFRDDRDIYGSDFNLNNTIKKEIMIEAEPSNFEEVVLYFNLFGGNPAGILDISINNKEFEAPLQPSSGLLIFASIKIPPSWLKKGLNTIILKPKGEIKSSIAIDHSYSFGRSYWLLQSGKWKRLEKGEYMLHLELKKSVVTKSNVQGKFERKHFS